MKIKLDNDNYIEIFEKNKSIFLSIKAEKDENSFILLTTKLNEESLDNLITALVKLKGRLE
jgi:hypothetical protein